VSGSGFSWAICKSAPRSRQINTPAPHYSVFYRLDALPATQPTVSKHWRHGRQTCGIHYFGQCHQIIHRNTQNKYPLAGVHILVFARLERADDAEVSDIHILADARDNHKQAATVEWLPEAAQPLPLANEVKNINCRQFWAFLMFKYDLFSCGVIHGSQLAPKSQHPKRHLQRLCRFCRVKSLPTDRSCYHGNIRPHAMPCEAMQLKNKQCYKYMSFTHWHVQSVKFNDNNGDKSDYCATASSSKRNASDWCPYIHPSTSPIFSSNVSAIGQVWYGVHSKLLARMQQKASIYVVTWDKWINIDL